MQFNVTIELPVGDRKSPEQVADELVDQLVDFHPAVAPAASGRLQVTITVDAEGIRQATLLGLGLIGEIAGSDFDPSGVAVIRTADYDSRLGLQADAEVNELLSVAEAAAELEISRQAVLKRILAGTMPASKTTGGWIVTRAAVDEARRRGRRAAGKAVQ